MSSLLRTVPRLFLSRPSSSLLFPSIAQRRFHSPALFNPSILLGGPANPNGDFLPRAEVKERMFKLFGHIKKINKDMIKEESSFADLGLDSLDTVEVIIQIEDEFAIDIYDPVAAEITTVKQAIDVVENFPFAK